METKTTEPMVEITEVKVVSRSPSPAPKPLVNKNLSRVSPRRSQSRCSVSRSRRVAFDCIHVGMDKTSLDHVYSVDLRRWLIEQGVLLF